MTPVIKKAAPPADLNPEHELPAAPEEKLIEDGHQHHQQNKSGLMVGIIIVLLVLLLALLAIAIR